jgi:aspartyl-tRNA(Asn)/glutamyl-tRNA(Gln) amidotransferase subunit A
MAIPSDDVFFASITELTERLRAKEFSAVELTRAFSDRIERLGPRYNALALSIREQAIRKAKDVDDELKRGRYRALQGIPWGAKDLIAVKGHPTTWGARPYAGQVFDEDAYVVQKLEKSGAILLGKLAMISLAGGGYRSAAASLTGPCLNPWDRTRWSGGSSSGSGAATAAGLVTFALGSETNGSIVTPSAFCGVTGFRPTYGLVSRRGVMAASWTMDKVGPICRSAEDCGLVLQAISGGDSQDPGSAGRGFSYTPQFARKPQELIVGYTPADFSEGVDPPARSAFQGALEAVKSLGVKLKEIALPDFPYGAVADTISRGDRVSIFEDLIQTGKINELSDPAQIAWYKESMSLSAREYLRAHRIRSLIQESLRTLFIDIDMIVAPSRTETAPKISEPIDAASSRIAPKPTPIGSGRLTSAGNLAGLPAISLPCGFVANLPIAISVVGRPWTENQLIGLARAFQTVTDWHRKRPPVE